METRREIDRIYKAAEQTAEDRAAAYITEKYGIDASTEGYCAATPAKWGSIVISRLPFEIEDILCISGGAEGWNVDRGNGKSQTYKQSISSQEEMDLLPEDGSDRDYKIHSNGTCGMSAGFQYAVAERKGEEE